jgi:hypothetical protein
VIVSPAFSYDDNAAAFSVLEKRMIISIWRAVAEDFAVWDVDVTTENPGVEGLRKANNADMAYGLRVVIGGHNFDWYSNRNTGGVAYSNSFNWDR